MVDTGKTSQVGHAPFVVAAVLVLLLGGALVRSVRLNEPALAWQPTRQYNDALLARRYEQVLGGSAAALAPAVVRAAAPAEIEPPILESITGVGWRVFGDEPLWFPRAVSILFWSIGGWLLFLLLRRLASPVAGVAGVVIWSFLPFSVTASRSFQPDPLMVTAITGALLALLVDDDEPSRRRLVIAGLAGGFAVLVKTPAIFFVGPVFVALTYRRGGLRALWSRRTALYAGLVLTPVVLYTIYGFWIAGFLQGQEGNRILPDLLVTQEFWRGWGRLGIDTFGVVIPVLALAGILLARGRAGWVGGALLAGYIAFGLVFTFHYMTHDYYHLPFVLVLSVGVGLLADRVARVVLARHADVLSIAVAAALVLVVLVGFRSGEFPLVPAAVPEATRVAEIDVPRKVGTLLHHATGVVFLAPSFGDTLMFYGGVAGTTWPETRTSDVKGTLDEIRRQHGAKFFAVTYMHQWAFESELRAYLNRFPVLASNRNFVLYDLRGAPA